MRTCARCQQSLPLEDFGVHRREKGSLKHTCRPCTRAYGRDHYQRNKGDYLEKARRWEAKMKALIDAAKNRPCTDCGQTFPPYVMDFDHLPGREKAFNVSAGRAIGLAKVQAEIDKCDLVCANCHRRRTWTRQHA